MKKTLQELSNEELIKDIKFKKIILGFYIGAILIIILSAIIITLKKGFNAFTFMPLTFIFLLILVWSDFNKVKEELETRNIK